MNFLYSRTKLSSSDNKLQHLDLSLDFHVRGNMLFILNTLFPEFYIKGDKNVVISKHEIQRTRKI